MWSDPPQPTAAPSTASRGDEEGDKSAAPATAATSSTVNDQDHRDRNVSAMDNLFGVISSSSSSEEEESEGLASDTPHSPAAKNHLIDDEEEEEEDDHNAPDVSCIPSASYNGSRCSA